MKSLYKYRIIVYNKATDKYVLQIKPSFMRHIEFQINQKISLRDTPLPILVWILVWIPFFGLSFLSIVFFLYFCAEIGLGWCDYKINNDPLELEKWIRKHTEENQFYYPDNNYKIYLNL